MPKKISEILDNKERVSCIILNECKDIENAHLHYIYLRYNPHIGKRAINLFP